MAVPTTDELSVVLESASLDARAGIETSDSARDVARSISLSVAIERGTSVVVLCSSSRITACQRTGPRLLDSISASWQSPPCMATRRTPLVFLATGRAFHANLKRGTRVGMPPSLHPDDPVVRPLCRSSNIDHMHYQAQAPLADATMSSPQTLFHRGPQRPGYRRLLILCARGAS